MKILFINSLLSQDWQQLKLKSLILVVFFSCVLIAILIDLWTGLDKARKLGVLRTSFGLRRTLIKIKDYFSVLMLFTIADIVASIWFSLPFFTAIGTIGIIIIEARSVYENKKGMSKGIKELPEVLFNILKNKDKVEELMRFLEESKNKLENQ